MTTKKGSISSARHMRKAVSGLFSWAAEASHRASTASHRSPRKNRCRRCRKKSREGAR